MAERIIEKINVYCPICQKHGYKKLIGKVDKHATGIIYLYCKGFSNGAGLTHKAQEITVNLGGQGATP